MKGTSHEQQQPLEAVPPMPIFNTTAITPTPWSATSSFSLTKGKGQGSQDNKLDIMRRSAGKQEYLY
jgi:hypothetical protein